MHELTRSAWSLRPLFMCAALFAALPAQAQGERLADLINEYRAAPPSCDGRRTVPVPALAAHPALARARIGPGEFLELALERASYPVAQADAIVVDGLPDARAVMDFIGSRYCRTLLNTQFSAIGASRSGDSWLILLARPAPPPKAAQLRAWADAGASILAAVNTARASARNCGGLDFPATRALSWNGMLGNAALAHSQDMASNRYFSHQGKDGRAVAERALGAGYRWKRIGENIAVGQESPDDVVAAWLSSPGHCANIMGPDFTEMGAAYAMRTEAPPGRVYWTQVLGTPR